MDDLIVRQFKNDIIAIMNKTEIPLEVKRLVLGEILNETTVMADNSIRTAIKAIKEQEAQKTNPENSPE